MLCVSKAVKLVRFIRFAEGVYVSLWCPAAAELVRYAAWTEADMLHGLGKLLVLLGKLLLLPIELFIWLEEAITGERRWLEQQRKNIQEREPLPDEGFLEAAGVSAEDVPTALATRRAVAEACGFPANALSPADALTTLRCLMVPGQHAHWADLGPDWFEVILHVGKLLGITLSGDALDEFDGRWREAERKGQLKNLGQLIGLLTVLVRAAHTTCSSSDASSA